jgi:hypothetical protein
MNTNHHSSRHSPTVETMPAANPTQPSLAAGSFSREVA